MVYTQQTVHQIVEKQKEYFKTNETLDVSFRIQSLKKLKEAIIKYQDQLVKALSDDLGRSAEEAYLCDVGVTIMEINETIKGLRRWARPERHFSGLVCFPSIVTKVYKMPYGTTLIMSPFNFPILLCFGVLTASLAGGNTAVLKVSSKSPNCSKISSKIISETFDEKYVTVIEGEHDVADMCLNEKFDKIFYTGSPKVARHIMAEASKNLTPVALELGGETGNWCIVRKDADIKDAARKIAFFKMCNSGQICININQVAVASEIADSFVSALKEEYEKQIGKDAIFNPEYPKLINENAYRKCEDEAKLYSDRIVFGGNGNIDLCKFNPTIIYPVKIDEEIVKHELFNPLLPVVTFDDDKVQDVLDVISDREKPLAFYVFTKDMKWAKKVTSTMQFGGGCINEVCYHMVVKGVPFNGVGHSGMGSYHGIWGFREFTHPTTVLKGHNNFNLPLRYHPYSGKKNSYKLKLMKKFEK